jgi:CheY-like chemotaxis protein
MSGGVDLGGRLILVVEDQYLIGVETVEALQDAGAATLGPCLDERTALAALTGERPDAAVVDVDLGQGPTFKVADALTARDVPFVFFTGFSQGTIPERFDGVGRMQKPVHVEHVIAAIAQLLGAAEPSDDKAAEAAPG